MSDPKNKQGGHDGQYEDWVPADDAVIGQAFRRSLVVIAAFAGVGIGGYLYANREKPKPPTVEPEVTKAITVTSEVEPPLVTFTDVTKSAGVDFVHFSGAAGDKLMPETMGGGCAFFDYDGDGDADLLLINGDDWPENRKSSPAVHTTALYRNDGNGGFEDVSEATGVNVRAYGMGSAVGDYDNDGDVDLFIAAVGRNIMLRNDGGKFADVTSATGVGGDDKTWSTSCGFADYDNDGDLDLFVCNYIKWSREIDLSIDYKLVGIGRAYGQPTNFEGEFNYLYRNNGDGSFADVTRAAGLDIKNPATDLPVGKALGLSTLDINGDGWIDFFVANDTTQNFLFVNNKDGTFKEQGSVYGLAFDRNGNATGAMGVDAAWYRNDETLGFFIGNFANEMTSLYSRPQVKEPFQDEAIVEGVGAPTRLMLTFGLFLFDYDLDGYIDLFQTNGHLEDEINKVQPSQHYEQPAQLFWNCGAHGGNRGCFTPVLHESVGDMSRPLVGRGAAYADIDGDGDLDLVITQVGRAPLLLRNDQSLGNHWLRVRAVGGDGMNRDAIGAVIEITMGDRMQRRVIVPTRSYLSQSELVATFGTGAATKVDELRITWPGGKVTSLKDVAVDRVLEISPE